MKRFLKITLTSKNSLNFGEVTECLINLDAIEVLLEASEGADRKCVIQTKHAKLVADQTFVEIKRQLQDGVV